MNSETALEVLEMALVTCPDCGKSVSDTAPTCVSCGRPMTSNTGHAQDVVTIQQTGKDIKLAQLFAGIAIVVGLVLLGNDQPIGGFVLSVGGLVYACAGFAKWWKHD